MKMGLLVTCIHRAIQFSPDRTFYHLGDEVQNIRRQADVDTSLAPKANMIKTEGNAYYGK